MAYQYFSHNGKVLPIEQAVVPLSSIEYTYGFGVYETIRLQGGTTYFLQEHCERLMESARVIDLEHAFSADFVQKSISELVQKTKAETCNLKVLLVGSASKDKATLSIMCLNPFFPDRKFYKNGAACITYNYERSFTGAKTLNMLPSYLAYRHAKASGAYDALLIDRNGCITEGTRTNFLSIKDRTIFTPKKESILPGIMRGAVLKVAKQNKFTVTERAIKLTDVSDFDSAFLTSSSSKIMPIQSIDGLSLGSPSPALRELMTTFNQFLDSYSNEHKKLSH